MVMTAEAAKTDNGNKIDWRTVRGLMVDAIYGGRVDNPHDMRVLATYLRRYFNSDVVSAPVLFAHRKRQEAETRVRNSYSTVLALGEVASNGVSS